MPLFFMTVSTFSLTLPPLIIRDSKEISELPQISYKISRFTGSSEIPLLSLSLTSSESAVLCTFYVLLTRLKCYDSKGVTSHLFVCQGILFCSPLTISVLSF